MEQLEIGITLADGENRRIGRIQRYAGGRIHVDVDERFLPGASGWHHESVLPEALRDALPDSFGMKVLTLAYGKRPESELAALLLGSDRHRLGALRLFDESGALIGSYEDELIASKPLPVMMRHLRDVVRAEPIPDRAIMRLLAGVSGSAGGARPKFLDEIDGQSVIVKLPKDDDVEDVASMEHRSLLALANLGMEPCKTWLEKLPGAHHALVVVRFDRTDKGRVPMISGRTAAALLDPKEAGESNASWEERISYEHLALFLNEHCHKPEPELERLFLLAVYNAAIGNTDNHLKNHAFLWDEHIGWRLAPAYDILPHDGLHHKLAFYFDRTGPVLRLEREAQMLELARRFDIRMDAAKDIIDSVRQSTRQS